MNRFDKTRFEMPICYGEGDDWIDEHYEVIKEALQIASDMEDRNVRIRHDLENNHIRKKIYNQSFTD